MFDREQNEETTKQCNVYVFNETYSASECDQAISDSIQAIQDAYLKLLGNNFYQYAIEFELTAEKEKLQNLFASEMMVANLKFWQESVGIHYSSDKTDLPDGKVCVKWIYDQDSFPVYFKIYYKTDYIRQAFEIDFLDIVKQVEEIKKDNLTYYANVPALLDEIDKITTKLPQMSDKERYSVLTSFNEKWDKQLTMTYHIDRDKREGTCRVEDKKGKVIIESSANNIKIDFEQTPSLENEVPAVAARPFSFWHRPLTSTVATALATGMGIGAAVYKITR